MSTASWATNLRIREPTFRPGKHGSRHTQEGGILADLLMRETDLRDILEELDEELDPDEVSLGETAYEKLTRLARSEQLAIDLNKELMLYCGAEWSMSNRGLYTMSDQDRRVRLLATLRRRALEAFEIRRAARCLTSEVECQMIAHRLVNETIGMAKENAAGAVCRETAPDGHGSRRFWDMYRMDDPKRRSALGPSLLPIQELDSVFPDSPQSVRSTSTSTFELPWPRRAPQQQPRSQSGLSTSRPAGYPSSQHKYPAAAPDGGHDGSGSADALHKIRMRGRIMARVTGFEKEAMQRSMPNLTQGPVTRRVAGEGGEEVPWAPPRGSIIFPKIDSVPLRMMSRTSSVPAAGHFGALRDQMTSTKSKKKRKKQKQKEGDGDKPCKLPPIEYPRAVDAVRPRPGRSSPEEAEEPEEDPPIQFDVQSATLRYIRVCDAAGVVPTASVLKMVGEHKICGTGELLVDGDLLAFAAMVRQMESLNEVDLSACSKLSDRALGIFMSKLLGRPANTTLRHLSLSGCRGAGREVISQLVNLFTHENGLHRLHHLDLSGVRIAQSAFMPFCQALEGKACIRSLRLADVGFGAQGRQQCLTCIFNMPMLEVVDVSGNAFSAEDFRAIGRGVAASKIQRLSLASCSVPGECSGSPPISQFLECMSDNRTLKFLDVSMNGIDDTGALVLEAAVCNHRRLQGLCIGHNPLGLEGVRSVLRLLLSDSCGILHFVFDNCENPNADDTTRFFNPTDPSGRYDLNLALPEHRALLRMLYRTCERFGLPFADAFRKLEYRVPGAKKKVPAYKHPEDKDANGVYSVPAEGELGLVFHTDAAILKMADARRGSKGASGAGGAGVSAFQLKAVASKLQAARSTDPRMVHSNVIRRFSDLVKIRPSFRKVTPFLSQFKGLPSDHVSDRQLLVDALSRDFLLSYHHLEQLCCAHHELVEVVSKLLPSVSVSPLEKFLLLSASSSKKYLQIHLRCNRFLSFNAENPTGHYQLDLSNPADYAVAETLELLDRWEQSKAQADGLADLSMLGNQSFVRNCTYRNTKIDCFHEWHLPVADVLELDYVSRRRPPEDASSIPWRGWRKMVRMVNRSKCRSAEKLLCLRMSSHQVFLQALQLRQLCGSFQLEESISLIVMFTFQIVDPQNMKALRVRIADWGRVLKRVGALATFPSVQPEGSSFNLNLSVYEERIATSLLVHLCSQERAKNIRNPKLLLPDGTWYPFDKGIPPRWRDSDGLPPEGQFECSYMCAPEDCNFAARRDVFYKYGGWNNALKQEEVMWWSGLQDVPASLITFLFFIVRDFADLDSAFVAIDGPGGNGEISRNEFSEAVAKFGWTPFKRKQAAALVFDFLDTDCKGTISRRQWDVVHQLWRELQLTILEFLNFINDSFNDLHEAFDAFDQDSNDSIEAREWEASVREVGYFGPSMPMFHFVTLYDGASGPPTLSRREWELLLPIWNKREIIFDEIVKGESALRQRFHPAWRSNMKVINFTMADATPSSRVEGSPSTLDSAGSVDDPLVFEAPSLLGDSDDGIESQPEWLREQT